jgi:hypothetical protein
LWCGNKDREGYIGGLIRTHLRAGCNLFWCGSRLRLGKVNK